MCGLLLTRRSNEQVLATVDCVGQHSDQHCSGPLKPGAEHPRQPCLPVFLHLVTTAGFFEAASSPGHW